MNQIFPPSRSRQAGASLSQALTRPADRVDVSTVEGIARAHYRIEAQASQLGGEKDGNFHLRAESGESYLLKIITPYEAPGISDFQTALLLHLEVAELTVPTPRIIRTHDGQPDFSLPFGDEGLRRIRLTRFLPGRLMRDAAHDTLSVAHVGATLGHLQRALRDFSHSHAAHPLIWDLSHAANLRDLLDAVENPSRRKILAEQLDFFDADLAPLMPGLRRQVVHNDFSGDNILVEATKADRIVGILDFGDAVHTALVNDVAAAAAYQLDRAPDAILATLRAFLAGFQTIQPLMRSEIELLYDFVIVRMVMRLAITEWRAARMPDNRAYILRNTPKVWVLLDRLLALPRNEARAILLGTIVQGAD